MTCNHPGCGGSIVDGYCDTCGLAPAATSPAAATSPTAAVGAPASAGTVTPGDPASGGSTRLGSVAIGSARSDPASRPTRRLGVQRSQSQLGAGITVIPPAPPLDPLAAIMNPAVVSEDKRYCAKCGEAVGRSRSDRPGRTNGFCPKCGSNFNFEPGLQPGVVVGGQYEVVGCLAHGGMGWIYLARDRNVNNRWVVLKGLLNAGDEDGYRAAVAEKEFLAEVEHPLIVEIYNFVTAPDGMSYIVMEYVGGKAISAMLKDRMAANNGQFSAIPVDQALAFIIEVLPAFAYLHSHGMLYCDFKPANIIQVGESIKLIDLGGVRQAEDDVSPIYGTVGFQAPEVPSDGTTVASDIYTIGRSLAVMVFEFRGYQNRFVDSLPAADEVPLFAQHDSLYRLIQKATATRPEDRFQSAEELRDQALGVLREVVATEASTTAATTRATPSALFGVPAAATDVLGWAELPPLRLPREDPLTDWLAAIGDFTLDQLGQAPGNSLGLQITVARTALTLGDLALAATTADAILAEDPWEWRGLWIHGLVAMSNADPAAVELFNTVYGQVPGELAPKLALARACEQAGQFDVAVRMYQVCARTDATYIAPAQFGLARIGQARSDRAAALAALDRIPSTSRSWGEARYRRATLLAQPDATGRHQLGDLDTALRELDGAGVPAAQRLGLRLPILAAALEMTRTSAVPAGTTLGGLPVDERSLRIEMEQVYRDMAVTEEDRRERHALIDAANRIRPWTTV